MNGRSIGALLMLTVAMPCTTLAAGDVPLDPTAFASFVEKANGQLPKAYVETVSISTSSGSQSISTDYVRGDGSRFVQNAGPFSHQSGVFQGEHWHQIANGLTIVEAPDPGGAPAPEATTTTTLTHVAEPMNAYVLATLDRGGYGTRQYVEATTYHLVRTIRHTPNGDITTTYDGFRPYAGATLPSHWTTIDAVASVTTDTRRISIEPRRPSDAEIAMPPVRGSLVTFPIGQSSTSLPVQFTDDGHVLIRVRIGTRVYDFLLDSGAGGIFINDSVASAAGLKIYGERSAVAASRYQSGSVVIPELHVGSLTMRNVVASTAPSNSLEREPHVAVAGLLGFDFFATLGLTIDYEHGQVTAVPAQSYRPPTGAPDIALDARIGTDVPETTVFINGARADRIIIDTGGVGAFFLFDYFARHNPQALQSDIWLGSAQRRKQFVGVGGTFDTQPYAIRDFSLGPVTFHDFIGYQVRSRSSYTYAADGLLGPSLLRLFMVGFDLADGRIDLVPNDDARRHLHITSPAKK